MQFTVTFEKIIILASLIFMAIVILILIGLVTFFANRRPYAENHADQLPAVGFPERDSWYPTTSFEQKYFCNSPTPRPRFTETEV